MTLEKYLRSGKGYDIPVLRFVQGGSVGTFNVVAVDVVIKKHDRVQLYYDESTGVIGIKPGKSGSKIGRNGSMSIQGFTKMFGLNHYNGTTFSIGEPNDDGIMPLTPIGE